MTTKTPAQRIEELETALRQLVVLADQAVHKWESESDLGPHTFEDEYATIHRARLVADAEPPVIPEESS